MVRTITPGHQKLAERLILLNDRGQGMLTRIYNIKKVGLDTDLFNHNIGFDRLAVIPNQNQHFCRINHSNPPSNMSFENSQVPIQNQT